MAEAVNLKGARQPKGVFAICYMRFSTKEQSKGDTIRRQTAKADEWSRREKIPINKTIRDRASPPFVARMP